MKNKSAYSFLKKKKNWIILTLILLIAFYLRVYHLDYPVIGYHNMKEVHYLTEARNFAREGFFKHGFFIPSWDYPNIKSDPSGAHLDTFPTTSIVAAFGFRLFGEKLVVARIINLMVGLLTVLFVYLFLKELFKREDVAIVGSLLLAVNPLHVFFSRNTQLINLSLLFLMISGYLFFKWYNDDKNLNLIFATLFFMFSFITKYPFLIFGIPLILIGAKKIFTGFKNNIIRKEIIISAIIILLFSVQLLQTQLNSNREKSEDLNQHINILHLIRLEKIKESSFWRIQKSYTSDNFTHIGLILAGLGLLFVLIKKEKKKAEWFTITYCLAAVPWFIILSFKLSGHNYYYYVFLPLFIILLSYCFMFISSTIESVIKIKHSKWIFIFILLCIVMIPSIKAKDRMFNTQFFGLDMAGEYLKYHKLPGERVIHSGHQAYGLLWHADMKGTSTIPNNLEDFKFAEEELNASWVFIYNWDFAKVSQNRELWNYLADNYKVVQTAFTANQNQITNLFYFLLKKGGSFNSSLMDSNGQLNVKVFSDILGTNPILNHEYELTNGKFNVLYVNT